MKILLLLLCLLTTLISSAQKNTMQYLLYSPDTLNYDIKITTDNKGDKMVYADFGTFNFSDEPSLNFYALPADHAFILDNALWNVAYLKPAYDKHYMVLPGKSGKVLSLQYYSKYNKYYTSPFKQTTSAHTTHGKISFEITGSYLPQYIHLDTPSFYHSHAITGDTLTDSFSVKNTGHAALLLQLTKYDEGMHCSDTASITILPGKERKLAISYTPLHKGPFSSPAEITFHLASEKTKHTAKLKIRGQAVK